MSIDSRPVGSARRYRVHADGVRIGWTDDPDRAVRYALGAVNQLAARHTRDAVLLHAGAVERDGRVMAITGISGQGKTTLTAALVRAGYGYVTDELVAIDPSTGGVEPYPKALDLDDEALALLGLDPPIGRIGGLERPPPSQVRRWCTGRWRPPTSTPSTRRRWAGSTAGALASPSWCWPAPWPTVETLAPGLGPDRPAQSASSRPPGRFPMPWTPWPGSARTCRRVRLGRLPLDQSLAVVDGSG